TLPRARSRLRSRRDDRHVHRPGSGHSRSFRRFLRRKVSELLASIDPSGEKRAVNEPGCYRVPLERYPGMSPLVLDWLAGDGRFLPRPSGTLTPAARSIDPILTNALIESN